MVRDSRPLALVSVGGSAVFASYLLLLGLQLGFFGGPYLGGPGNALVAVWAMSWVAGPVLVIAGLRLADRDDPGGRARLRDTPGAMFAMVALVFLIAGVALPVAALFATCPTSNPSSQPPCNHNCTVPLPVRASCPSPLDFLGYGLLVGAPGVVSLAAAGSALESPPRKRPF